MTKNPNKKEDFYLDTIDNLIRWDMFYIVNENFCKQFSNSPHNKNDSGATLEACDLYLLGMKDCEINKGNKALFCIADPKDEDILGNILTTMFSVSPKEPVMVKRSPSYQASVMNVIHMLDRKKDEAPSEGAKNAVKDLTDRVAAVIAKEHGFDIKPKKDEDGKDDTN